ncbi:hypothetical protein EDC30_11141 [Paucimonas lemoignei]|uniref:CAAX prenyl protease 2/Lysostaphin resistance protein A-like domain-containing protein n=1 Tax=Paucimonas lemoignei TaxID=29443 RepID=A0A4V2UIA7_PAULE|nr:CPBP family intramembrane glutamic endopeptidase [Paucimonas lemoignei]TCS35128.1 hypothetical protein EDC30_11141 [Paucimonas lemoignei]
MPAAFVLLALAVCATWARPMAVGRWRLAPWLLLFIAAIVAGMLTGVLEWPGLIALAALAYCAYRTGRNDASRAQQWVFGIATALLTLALALHRLPGFHNPVLLANAILAPDAAPFTQYANFDKGAAGAILLACLCRQAGSAKAWRKSSSLALVIVLATIAIVLVTALMLGHVRFAPKLIAYAPVFLLVNLFFTCVAEEAFFRGFMQERMARALACRRGGAYLAIAVSALLFGLAHAGGGAVMVMLATLAGLGYAIAYAKAGTIEAPILVHFALNAVHFIGFSYPYLR